MTTPIRTFVARALFAGCAPEDQPSPIGLVMPAVAPPLGEPVLLRGTSNLQRSSGFVPGERVYMAISTSPPGQGPCPTSLPRCLDLVDPIVVGVERADGSGSAVFDVNPPTAAPDTLITMQTAAPASGRMSSPSQWWVLGAGDDLDGDGLDNAEELAAGTNPFEGDTDGGGASDGDELAVGLDPVADPDDDLLLLVSAVAGTVDVTLELGSQWSIAGYRRCTFTYDLATTAPPAAQPDFFSDSLLLIANGTWEVSSHNCSPQVMADLATRFVWSDPAVTSRFHFAFDPSRLFDA